MDTCNNLVAIDISENNPVLTIPTDTSYVLNRDQHPYKSDPFNGLQFNIQCEIE